MESHYELILRETDRRIQQALQEQELDKANRFCGGFCNQNGVVMVKHTVYRLMTMLSGLMNERSAYYASGMLEERIAGGLAFVEKKQHENGLFDYETCNFDSPPDTAFLMKKILPTYAYLNKTGMYQALQKRLENLLKKGAQGLLLGGFHTPNHRWAIASVLACCGKRWNEAAYLAEAERYLAEGIDINEDGEYAERSAGNYNRVNNDSMLLLAQALDRAEFETYAVRNLTMMLSYIEPDGSIFTENSTRYDKDLLVFPRYYYWQYLVLGHRHQRKDFLQMANGIMERIVKNHLRAPDILIAFMNDPEMISVADSISGTEPRPSRFFAESGVVRINTPDRSVTILANHPAFLHVQYDEIKLSVELQGGFFEHRGFVGERVEQTGDGAYTLRQSMRGWYYLPFAAKPETADWWQMDNGSRPKRMGPVLEIKAQVTITDSEIELALTANGVEDAPFRLLFSVAGSTACSQNSKDLDLYGKEGRMTIGPGFHEHGLTEAHADAAGVGKYCFTCCTPFEKRIGIRFFKQSRII